MVVESPPLHLDEEAKALWRHCELCVRSPAAGENVKALCLSIKRELSLEAMCGRLRSDRMDLIQACNLVIHSRLMPRDLAEQLNETVGRVTGNL